MLLIGAWRRQNQIGPDGDNRFNIGFGRCAHNSDIACPGLDVIGNVAAATGNYGTHWFGIDGQCRVQGTLIQCDYSLWLAVDRYRAIGRFHRPTIRETVTRAHGGECQYGNGSEKRLFGGESAACHGQCAPAAGC